MGIKCNESRIPEHMLQSWNKVLTVMTIKVAVFLYVTSYAV
jgi:hypothetical protein